MKINIIGGGPAGMYFAILTKKANPSHQITVYERNGPDDTFGWGVVFSGRTLANLRAADAESHAEITCAFEAWDNVDVVHHDSKISIHGNSFSGISRLQLLKILQRRCEQLAVELLFRNEVSDIASRQSCDLLVAADGVNKTTSTFIIECDQETWNTAGFTSMSDEETRGYLEQVFAKDLDGQPLLSNNSKWINFLLVKNEKWHFEEV